jgi:hypothetical protein
VAILALFAVSAIAATGLQTVVVPGQQATVSCLSARLCVLGGENGQGVGDLMRLRDGTRFHLYTVPGTRLIYSVSCPGASGCVALGRPSDDVGARLTAVSASGVPETTRALALPAGVTVGRIACIALDDCELAGLAVAAEPFMVELGSWNGHSLTLHPVPVPSPNYIATDTEIACEGSACVLVGVLETASGATIGGYTVATRDGSPGVMHVVPGVALYGIGCTSVALCYAAGDTGSGRGEVVVLRRGVAVQQIPVGHDLDGIGCGPSACVAAGSITATGLPQPFAQLFVLSSGTITARDIVERINIFDDVAMTGDFYAAVEPSLLSRASVVSSGTTAAIPHRAAWVHHTALPARL